MEQILYSCLCNRMKTEITRRNREKRRADRIAVSIDMSVGDGDDSTIGDLIADDFDMEREIFGEESARDCKMERYLGRLSAQQRKVAELLAASYSPGEIQRMLHMTKREYSDAMRGIRAYDNISILF